MRLFRRVEKLKFDDGEVEVKEITAGTLAKLEEEGKALTLDMLIEECTGLKPDDLTAEAYTYIAEKILEMHKELFETDEKEPQPKTKKKQ